MITIKHDFPIRKGLSSESGEFFRSRHNTFKAIFQKLHVDCFLHENFSLRLGNTLLDDHIVIIAFLGFSPKGKIPYGILTD
jgi:hypothetical protein